MMIISTDDLYNIIHFGYENRTKNIEIDPPKFYNKRAHTPNEIQNFLFSPSRSHLFIFSQISSYRPLPPSSTAQWN